jgi:hypothetical protein
MMPRTTAVFAFAVCLGFSFPARSAAPLTDESIGRGALPPTELQSTTDVLTGLPLFPGSGAPVKIPGARWCKSAMQANFYKVSDSTVMAAAAWYASHLRGFKKTHAYASGRWDDTFYNSSGTLFVLIMGNPGTEGENTQTYAVTYYRVQPGVSERSIIGLNQQKVVCP